MEKRNYKLVSRDYNLSTNINKENRHKLLMMLFSTGTGLERVGVVVSDLDCWRPGMQAPRLSGLK